MNFGRIITSRKRVNFGRNYVRDKEVGYDSKFESDVKPVLPHSE